MRLAGDRLLLDAEPRPCSRAHSKAKPGLRNAALAQWLCQLVQREILPLARPATTALATDCARKHLAFYSMPDSGGGGAIL